MFSRTVINDMSRGIACSTDVVRAGSVIMSPVVAETTLVSKKSRGRMSQRG